MALQHAVTVEHGKSYYCIGPGNSELVEHLSYRTQQYLIYIQVGSRCQECGGPTNQPYYAEEDDIASFLGS